MVEIATPASKSELQRAIAAASFAQGTSKFTHCSLCKDTEAALAISRALGAQIESDGDSITIAGGAEPPKQRLNCNESGLCFRMFSILAALFESPVLITGSGSLLERPHRVADILNQFGVKVLSSENTFPLHIQGPLKPGSYSIDCADSSQILTGLLMALPLLTSNSTLEVSNLKSKPYVLMTISTLEKFGIKIKYNSNLTEFQIDGNQVYQSCSIEIEADWSAAAFLLVAGAIYRPVTVCNLNINSLQADREIFNILKSIGAQFEIARIPTSNAVKITVKPGSLKAFDYDASDSPDLFPSLVCLASRCDGVCSIRGVSRLKGKESNRGEALVTEFSKLGLHLYIENDIMYVNPGEINGGCFNSWNDHRIAMAGAIVGLVSKSKVDILNSECVSKSYPNFFEEIEKIRA